MPLRPFEERDSSERSNEALEEKFMQILYNFLESSNEEKRFLINNCDAVFGEHENSEWILNVLDTMVGILETINLNATNSRHKLPDVPSDNGYGRSPWTFAPHNSQYISYLMSRLLLSKGIDVRSKNLIHKVILKLFRKTTCPQVKAALLRFSTYFARYLTSIEVEDLVLPLVPFCLNSRNIEALAAALEAIPKLMEYTIPEDVYENCLNKAVNAFKKSASRPQIQSLAIQCMVNILPHLSLDTVEKVVLPFALESIADAAQSSSDTIAATEASKSSRNSATYPGNQDVCSLIPSYLIEFDFLLSEGEPIISLCSLLKGLLRERRSVLSLTTIAMEIIPRLLPHTLNKKWDFSEFKYIMSTLYEYLNYINETNSGRSNNEPLSPSNQSDATACPKREIKVCIDRGSTSDENAAGGSGSYPMVPRCVQRRGSGNIILPLINTSLNNQSAEPRARFNLGEDQNEFMNADRSSNKVLSDASTNANRLQAPSHAFRNSLSTQQLLSGANLLTVAVCEGPFGLPDKNRRRSAIDLRSATEAVPPSPSQNPQSPYNAESPRNTNAKLDIFGVFPNIRRASENALNISNIPFLTSKKS